MQGPEGMNKKRKCEKRTREPTWFDNACYGVRTDMRHLKKQRPGSF